MNLYSIDFGGRTMFMTRIVDGKYISVKAPNGKEQFTNAIQYDPNTLDIKFDEAAYS